jgi:hypothetical protein
MHDPRSPANPSLRHSDVKAISPVSTAWPAADSARTIYSYIREKSTSLQLYTSVRGPAVPSRVQVDISQILAFFFGREGFRGRTPAGWGAARLSTASPSHGRASSRAALHFRHAPVRQLRRGEWCLLFLASVSSSVVRRRGLKVTNRANLGLGAFSFNGRAIGFFAAIRLRCCRTRNKTLLDFPAGLDRCGQPARLPIRVQPTSQRDCRDCGIWARRPRIRERPLRIFRPKSAPDGSLIKFDIEHGIRWVYGRQLDITE